MKSSVGGVSPISYSDSAKPVLSELVLLKKVLRDVTNVVIFLARSSRISLFLSAKRLYYVPYQLGESLELSGGWRKKKSATIALIVATHYSEEHKDAGNVESRWMLIEPRLRSTASICFPSPPLACLPFQCH